MERITIEDILGYHKHIEAINFGEKLNRTAPCGGFSYEYIGSGECRISPYGNIKYITVSDYEISAGFKNSIKDNYALQMKGAYLDVCEQNENGFKIMLADDNKKIRLEKSIKVVIVPVHEAYKIN